MIADKMVLVNVSDEQSLPWQRNHIVMIISMPPQTARVHDRSAHIIIAADLSDKSNRSQNNAHHKHHHDYNCIYHQIFREQF